MRKQATANPLKGLQGQVAGVYITTNGNPNGPATIRIRGVGTFNNNNPLIVVDGVPTRVNIQELNPADIESMQILKDAASATIYGARAANGVILITTKKGKFGKLLVNADASTSFSVYTAKPPLLDANGYGTAYWQAAVNTNRDPNANTIGYQFDWNKDASGVPHLNKVILQEYLDPNKTMKTSNTDWFDEVSQTGLIQNYNVNVSNGTARGSYLFSLGYFDNDGVVKTTSYKRLSARLNSSYKMLNNKLEVGENFTVIKTTEKADPNVLNLALQAMPIVPVHTVDGKGWGGPWGGMNDRQNPVRILEDNKQNLDYMLRIFGNIYANLNLAKGLTFRSDLGLDYSSGNGNNFLKTYTSGYLVGNVNRLTMNFSQGTRMNWTNTLNYTKTLSKHTFGALIGTEYIDQEDMSFSTSREGFAIQDPDYTILNAGSGNKDNTGGAAHNALFSLFGQVDYKFNDKYLASFKIRRDGSSRFGKNNRYGTYPAAAVAWRISQEEFFSNLVKPSVISDLKLRVSWGQMGSQESDNAAIYTYYISDYTGGTQPNVTVGTAYDLSGGNTGTLPSGYRRAQTGNDDLKWETTEITNFALDFGLFNQKLTGTVEYYIKKTSDILVLPPALSAAGEGARKWVNGASMENKGWEVTLGTTGKIGALNFELSGNITGYKNKVTYLPTSVVNAYGGNGTTDNILGRALNSYYGHVTDGLFRTQAEVDNHPTQNGKGLGRIRYKDLNNDKVINNANDRTWIGDPNPDFFYGLNIGLSYKRFDLSAFFQGVNGNAVVNDVKYNTDFWSVSQTGSNKGTRTLEAWTPQNPNSDIPMLTALDANNEARLSTYFIEDGSYLKLRNMQIGYNFGASMLSRAKMQKARVYVGGDNLLLLVKSKSFTGLDPETPGFGYPNPKIFTIGLILGF
jgi:TonB-linked SusC/RagA family outer membrane protein